MWGNIIGGGLSLIGGLLGGQSSSKAADTQAQAADRQMALQREMWEDNKRRSEPWYQAGKNALEKLIPELGYQNFGQAQFQADPGYQFRLAEGQRTIDNSAAARGGLQSGNALRAAAAYGQNLGSQEYGNAFNRYLQERSAKLNPLMQMSNIGQNAATGQANNNMNFANMNGQADMNKANAQAGGIMAGSDAMQKMIGGLGGQFQDWYSKQSPPGGAAKIYENGQYNPGFRQSSNKPSWWGNP